MKKINILLSLLMLSIAFIGCGGEGDPMPEPYELPKTLRVWLDGKDVAAGGALEAGPISVWKDKSGKGNNLQMRNSPAFRGNGFTFVGNQGGVNTALDTTLTSLTLFIVVDSSDFTGGWKYLSSMTFNNESPWSSKTGFGVAKRFNVAELGLLYNNNTGTPIAFPTHDSGKGFVGVSIDASSITTYANGLSATTAKANTIKVNQLAIAQHSANSNEEYYRGRVHEVLVFSNVLTEAERQKVEGYLAHKWGTAGKLPATHPYKSKAP